MIDATQPAQTNFIGVLVTFFSFCGGILVLAVSPEKWQTFKKMVLAFVKVALVLIIVGLTIASLLPRTRILVAELTGQLCVSTGFLGATLTGWHHVRSLNR